MLVKKRVLIISLLVSIIWSLSAEIGKSRFKITESEEEFDVEYYLTPDMTVINNKENNDVSITQSFMIRKNGTSGELRYSLFTDVLKDNKDLQIQYAMWVFMCLNNIAGYEIPDNAISVFDENDVKEEFNGNFGCTTFIQNPKSEYGEGYSFMMVEFFYKEKQGLVMRTFLFDDAAFLGMTADGQISSSSPLFTNYHTFRFMN